MLPTARSVLGAGVLAIGCPLAFGAPSVQAQAPSAQAQAPRSYAPAPVYSYPAPVYTYSTPPYYAPAPVYSYPAQGYSPPSRNYSYFYCNRFFVTLSDPSGYPELRGGYAHPKEVQPCHSWITLRPRRS
jgi:hypothetical protein